MNKRVKTLFFFALPLFLIQIFSAEPDSIRTVLKKYKQYQQNFPQQKLYVHTDRDNYYSGDTIYYKSYLTNATSHVADTITGVTYVELISPNNTVIQRNISRTKKGFAIGDFLVNDSITGGIYRLRAYTTWMLNFDTEFFFSKPITIYGSRNNKLKCSGKASVSKQDTVNIVDVTLTITDPDGKPKISRYYSKVSIDGKEVFTDDLKTNANGETTFQMTIPSNLNATNANIELKNYWDRLIKINTNVSWKEKPTNISFFPEGGHLVAGLTSKIAFKVTNSQGMGIAANGEITDSLGKIVTTFETIHDGMGYFSLTPQLNTKYLARINSNDSTRSSFNLPVALEKGFVMEVQAYSFDDIVLNITSNNSFINNQGLSLIGQTRGKILYSSKINLDNTNTSIINIPKEELPDGITQFTLFDNKGQPQCERLVFVNNNEQLKIEIITDTTDYKPRSKTQLTIKVTDADNQPVVANLSMAVLDKSQTTTLNNQTNIVNYMLLSSDLKGRIENPGFYFINNNLVTRAKLDLLMMVNGWRRFVWKEILADSIPKSKHEMEAGLYVSGQIKELIFKKAPIPNLNLTLVNNKFIKTTKTDKDGRFYFDGHITYTDTTKTILEVKKKKRPIQVKVLIDKYVYPFVSESPYTIAMANIAPNDSNVLFLNKLKNKHGLNDTVIPIEEVVIKKRYRTYTMQELATKYVDLNKHLSEFKDIYDLLRYLGFDYYNSIITKHGRIPIIFLNEFNLTGFCNQINDIELASQNELSQLEEIPLEEIQEVLYYDTWATKPVNIVLFHFNLPFITALNYNNWDVLVFKIKNPRYANVNSFMQPKGINTVPLRCYYKAREFYSPDYDKNPDLKDKPDNRTTVYWNPKIVTDENGEAKVEYFNNHNISNVSITIEGLSKNGWVGSQKMEYKIAK